MSSKSSTAGAVTHASLRDRLVSNWQLYAMLLIPVALTIIYKYIPMYGIGSRSHSEITRPAGECSAANGSE